MYSQKNVGNPDKMGLSVKSQNIGLKQTEHKLYRFQACILI